MRGLVLGINGGQVRIGVDAPKNEGAEKLQGRNTLFDPLWRDKKMKRKAAYTWLADQLGIHVNDCHIGMFDVDMCRRVVEVCGLSMPITTKEKSNAG